MERETVGDIVKNESTRQAVILVFSVAGAIATVAAMRGMQNPDLMSYYRMWWALKTKRFADRQVDFWGGVSAQAANRYNSEKM